MQRNTTALIGAWTMEDTGESIVGRFQSALDVNALIATLRGHTDDAPPEVSRTPLLMKSADDEDWSTLPAEVRDPA